MQAGTLNILSGNKKEFFDWEYAKKVWFEMNTWEAEEKEWAKYSSDFEPWLEIWKKNHNQAKKLLATYPEPKKTNIQRAFDIQLAWDNWYDEHYWPWWERYQGALKAKNYGEISELTSFDEDRVRFNARRKELGRDKCVPQRFITECGLMPDWRSPEMIAEGKRLEARRAELMGTPAADAELKKLKALQDALK